MGISCWIRDRKGSPKNFCDKDLAELSGELSGAICLKTLVLLGNALELFRKFFGALLAILWLWGSFWGGGLNVGVLRTRSWGSWWFSCSMSVEFLVVVLGWAGGAAVQRFLEPLLNHWVKACLDQVPSKDKAQQKPTEQTKFRAQKHDTKYKTTSVIDLLMGLFRGAVFRHGGGVLK